MNPTYTRTIEIFKKFYPDISEEIPLKKFLLSGSIATPKGAKRLKWKIVDKGYNIRAIDEITGTQLIYHHPVSWDYHPLVIIGIKIAIHEYRRINS